MIWPCPKGPFTEQTRLSAVSNKIHSVISHGLTWSVPKKAIFTNPKSQSLSVPPKEWLMLIRSSCLGLLPRGCVASHASFPPLDAPIAHRLDFKCLGGFIVHDDVGDDGKRGGLTIGGRLDFLSDYGILTAAQALNCCISELLKYCVLIGRREIS